MVISAKRTLEIVNSAANDFTSDDTFGDNSASFHNSQPPSLEVSIVSALNDENDNPGAEEENSNRQFDWNRQKTAEFTVSLTPSPVSSTSTASPKGSIRSKANSNRVKLIFSNFTILCFRKIC